MANTATNIPWAVADPWPEASTTEMFTFDDDAEEVSSIKAPKVSVDMFNDTKPRAGVRRNSRGRLTTPKWRQNDGVFKLHYDPRLEGTPKMTEAEIESARNMDLYMLHQIHFELVTGDTLVFVDLPNSVKDSRKQADCDNIAYRSQSFRVSSETLLATGSAKFKELLGPSYQFRVQRRRKLVNKLPEGVKFVLDLTPPSEGDDLVFQMTELSLTPGITNWWISDKFHTIDPAHVSGHDDACTCKRQSPSLSAGEILDPGLANAGTLATKPHLPPTASIVDRFREEGNNELYLTPQFRKIPDYCAVRHRNAIVRLLIVIEGRDICLDSASRVWTLIGVAKILDCIDVIRDRVAQWLLQPRNSRFIEVLPEEALRIGYDLKLPDVTKTAFRILVNEMAIREAGTPGTSPKAPRTTVFGRRMGEVRDELQDLIQHAARALVERISMLRMQLQSPDILDYWDIEEWRKLCHLESLLTHARLPGEGSQHDLAFCRHRLVRLKAEISKVVSSRITNGVEDGSATSSYLPGMDTDRLTYVLPCDFEHLDEILLRFNTTQSLLCPFVYEDLAARCNEPLFIRVGSLDANCQKVPSLRIQLQDSLRMLAEKNPELAYVEGWDNFLDMHLATMQGGKPQFNDPVIDLVKLDIGIKDALQPTLLSWLRHDIEPPANITRHMLLALGSNEMKFLPLWADGLNDGSGGVFEDFIPPTDMGPNGPGPAFHTGNTIPSGPPSISDSLMEEIRGMKVQGSETAASVDVHDSISTVYRPDKVIADDVSIATESFDTADNEYHNARFAVPAEHQSSSHGVEALVESITDSGSNFDVTSSAGMGTEYNDDDYDMGDDTPQASEDEDSDDSLVDVGYVTSSTTSKV